MSGLSWAPVDSTEARELRDEQLEHTRTAPPGQQHPEGCDGGWLGEDDEGRPVPCMQCRPHLKVTDCRTCSTTLERCDEQRSRGRGRCCDHCAHDHPEKNL